MKQSEAADEPSACTLINPIQVLAPKNAGINIEHKTIVEDCAGLIGHSV